MRTLLVAIAGLLGPGFGHGLAGRGRGMAIWITVVTASMLACAVSIWAVPGMLAVRVVAAIDGARVAGAARRAGRPPDWIGALIAVGATAAIGVGIHLAVLETFKAPASSMVPTIEVGDQFVVDKLTLRWRPVARGEVIVFQQPCEPARDYIKRVIALGGDTVEIRCGVVHVNGAPLVTRLALAEGCRYDDRDEMSGSWHDRACSAYDETTGDRTYRVYDDPERPQHDARPAAERPASPFDFPRLDGLEPPACGASFGATAGGGAGRQRPGQLVQTGSGGPCDRQLHYVVPHGHVFTMGDSRNNSNDSRFWGAVPVENIRGRAIGIWRSGGKDGLSFRRFGPIP